MEKVINEVEAKAAVYEYIMSHIADKDFESTAAVAGDVLNLLLSLGKAPREE